MKNVQLVFICLLFAFFGAQMLAYNITRDATHLIFSILCAIVGIILTSVYWSKK